MQEKWKTVTNRKTLENNLNKIQMTLGLIMTFFRFNTKDKIHKGNN